MLQLVYAPHEIFKIKADKVAIVNDEIRQIINDMFATMYFEKGVGIGANMVGILKRIIVIDLMENGVSKPYAMVNPEITYASEETQIFEEASLCFRGIAAKIARPKNIIVKFLDYNAQEQILEAEGFFATVIQHETDYLNGITFLDHLSSLKRSMLLAKMQKYIKQNPPHIHGAHCNH